MDSERGPTALAGRCEAAIARLKTEMGTATPAERVAIRDRLREVQALLQFCKTRVVYTGPQ